MQAREHAGKRVEAFASLLWDGVYSYTCVALATTPGEFVVPPAKAEEMYDVLDVERREHQLCLEQLQ